MRAALAAAADASSLDSLAAAVAAYPELRTQEPFEEWRLHGEAAETAGPRTAGQLATDQLTGSLLTDLIQKDVEEAWWRHTVEAEQAVSLNRDEVYKLARESLVQYDIGGVSQELADSYALLAERAEQCDELHLAGVLWETRGKVLQRPKLSGPVNIEEAVKALERAVVLFERLDQQAAATTAKHNLAGALRDRARDRVASIERGISLLEEVIAYWAALPDPEGEAMARTNLAVLLLDRKLGILADNAWRALGQCQDALRYRSLARDPVDYVYTLANLALAQQRLAESENQYIQEAESTYNRALEALPPDSAPWLRAELHGNFTDMLTTASEKIPGQREQYLRKAEEYGRKVVAVHSAYGHFHELPFAQKRLARILVRQAASDSSPTLHEARDLYLAALEILTPDAYPADCLIVADETADLCVRLDDWCTASAARVTALAAWRATGGDLVSRGALPQETGPLPDMLTKVQQEGRHRDCAYALFRVAQQDIADGKAADTPQVQAILREAVRTMEEGRATMLRTSTGTEAVELARLRVIDADLAEAYVTALREVREEQLTEDRPTGSEPGSPSPETLRRLEAVLETIRERPALSGFARSLPPSLSDMRKALSERQALVYLIARPEGGCALIVTPSSHPVPIIGLDLRNVRSSRLVTLTLGVGMRTDGSLEGVTPGRPRSGDGMLWGATDSGLPQFGLLLRKILGELGPQLAQPLEEALCTASITEAVLVPCGRIGSIPWHAATWRDHRGETSLSATLTSVTYAPSMGSWMSAQQRAARTAKRPPHLVGIANPRGSRPPLLGAEAELKQIATGFAPELKNIAWGPEATGDFLIQHLPQATHVHLGCHGKMWHDGKDRAALTLADGEQLTISRIRRLAGENLRLVVTAACESGTVELILQPEEAIGLSTAFLHAGAAGVLGALWQIPDLPTALFITKFYELLRDEPNSDPGKALTETQAWMRTLTGRAARRYLAERPLLKAAQRSGALRGTLKSTRSRPAHRVRHPSALERLRMPYAGPEYWAGFVLYGC
ncbi:CHAT domain-containing protein [Streptomyces sp. NPDC001978]|uniref:CHAT domain-containing protein n=1 Tax=Streptomyces sp. NPDC001978 TaxID=3364627 RepID=UPI0036D16AEC